MATYMALLYYIFAIFNYQAVKTSDLCFFRYTQNSLVCLTWVDNLLEKVYKQWIRYSVLILKYLSKNDFSFNTHDLSQKSWELK